MSKGKQITITLTSTVDETEFDVLNDIVQEVEGHIFVLDGSVKIEIDKK